MSGEANVYDIFGLLIDKEIALLFLGAIIGFGASLVTNWINNCSKRKKEEKEKAINIIADTVKFVEKTSQRNNFVIGSMAYLNNVKLYQTIGVSISEQKKECSHKIDTDWGSDFFEERNFHSFQLKRLSNKELWEKFDALMNAHDKVSEEYEGLGDPLYEYETEEEEFKGMHKKFINYCVEISRVNAPIRTPGAPDKKKDPAKKS